MADQPTQDNNQVKLIVASASPDLPSAEAGVEPFEEQGFFRRKASAKVDEATADLQGMVGDYERIRNQIRAIFIEPEGGGEAEGGFGLQELTVHLGISAKGGIGFIAELGVDASIELTFRRK
jgi:hypothetical protein